MRRRTFLFSIPAAMSAMAAALMPLSLPAGLTLLLLTMLTAVGLAFLALRHANAERDRREREQGNAPEGARSAWEAGRWLARH
ncbi:hypothetical protein GCM10027187_38820 [Streptosporangium sandarakinum]